MRVGLFTDRRMLDHRVPAGHPERPERLQAILRHLQRTGYLSGGQSGTVHEATAEELARVHSTDYLHRLGEIESAGGGMVDPDTWVSPGTRLAAHLAVGAGIEAVSFVLGAPERRALCLVRPPGHHALPSAGMGFCIYANIALAAAEALSQHEVNRVLIADFDVHHGNGTQEIFYESDRVAFLSIHRYPFYPGTVHAMRRAPGGAWGTPSTFPCLMAPQPTSTMPHFDPVLKSWPTAFDRSLS